ncbi:HTH domain-containing protein [Haloarcula sp. KBTZ06]|uniref:HTH domain-containing protein n=1 Tax=Haloarcula sp. KBTZ06 TaxID=3402682 RepID=UPI003B42BD0B
MSSSTAPGSRRATLFVRSDLPALSQKRCTAIERELQELVCRGVLDDVDTVEWEKRVPLQGSGNGPERDLYNEFAEWAREAGGCLAPFFDTRLCYSSTTGEKRRELVMPAVCLAVYESGDLVQVAPFADRGRTESVEECIAELAETGALPDTYSTTVSTV